ncbi:MAG: saccharopine dehydrogenase family protein [Candidatus Promineifilaceae bacterium]
MFRYLLIGAGDQAVAIADWLLRRPDTGQVMVVDQDMMKLSQMNQRFGADRRLRTHRLVLPDQNLKVRGLMTNFDVAIGATSYRHYLEMSRLAIDAKCHWLDLGGKIAVRKEQTRLAALAEAAGVSLAPDQGIAPGSVSIPARYVLDLFGGEADLLLERVGGIPTENIPPCGYAWAFAGDGLIQEMEAPAEILEDGLIKTVPSLNLPLECHPFAQFGRLYSTRTSDGNSTFPETFAGKVKRHDYATLRWPGHWEMMIALRDLGFWNPTAKSFGQGYVSPREMTVRLLDENLPRNVPSALVLRIIGARDGVERWFDMVCRDDEARKMTSMQVSTGRSAAITAWMLASGAISKRGEVRLERDAPVNQYLELWAESGMTLTEVNPEEIKKGLK